MLMKEWNTKTLNRYPAIIYSSDTSFVHAAVLGIMEKVEEIYGYSGMWFKVVLNANKIKGTLKIMR